MIFAFSHFSAHCHCLKWMNTLLLLFFLFSGQWHKRSFSYLGHLSTDISGSSRNEGVQSSQPPGIPNFTFEPPAAFPPSQTPHQHLSSIPDPPREPIPQEIRIFYLLFPLFFHELPFPGAFPTVQDRGGFEAGHHEERWGFCCSQFPSPGFQSFLPRDFRASFPRDFSSSFPGISALRPHRCPSRTRSGLVLQWQKEITSPSPSTQRLLPFHFDFFLISFFFSFKKCFWFCFSDFLSFKWFFPHFSFSSPPPFSFILLSFFFAFVLFCFYFSFFFFLFIFFFSLVFPFLLCPFSFPFLSFSFFSLFPFPFFSTFPFLSSYNILNHPYLFILSFSSYLLILSFKLIF